MYVLGGAQTPQSIPVPLHPQGLPVEEQFRLVNSASIVLMMHGAALGLWPFLPRWVRGGTGTQVPAQPLATAAAAPIAQLP